MLLRVLLCVSQPGIRTQLKRLMADHDVIQSSIRSKSSLFDRLSREGSDLVIISESFLTGHEPETILTIRQLPDPPAVVVISEKEDPEKRAQLVAAGCDAVLNKNLPQDHIKEAVCALLERHRSILRKTLPEKHITAQPSLNDFVSASHAMQTFMDIVRRVVNSDSSILILGETGVGKERLARAVHAESHRSAGPFIAVNCGALPEALLESELFGHEQGAFTGATRARRGWFELAHRGTIFLDEIGDMPIHLQVKLLRVLQEKKIQRVGSEQAVDIDVRVMAASNRDLNAEIERRQFRKDLFYRLCVVTLTIPALRDRREDIPQLIDSYIAYLRTQTGREVYAINNSARQALCRYPWPGNVRELINVLERAVLLCNGDTITEEDLPSEFGAQVQSGKPLTGEEPCDKQRWLNRSWSAVRREYLDRLEHAYFSWLLAATGGRIGVTAERAGIQTRSLFDKMKRLGLDKKDFR